MSKSLVINASILVAVCGYNGHFGVTLQKLDTSATYELN